MFAIITFRHSGPIKTWAAMQAANVHNARTKPLAHAISGAPAPEHLIGTGDLVRDVKQKLRNVAIDPDRKRKNGVLAFEAILSASPEFFERGSSEEKASRLREWAKAQVDWAVERYGRHRIASLVLHVDEKTPHMHLVVLPLEVKSDKRRKDTGVRWSLVGRTISGPGKFDEAQDAYAAAMNGFGLIRGMKGSGRKHEPVPVFLARMGEKERAVDAALQAAAAEVVALAVERQALERDRASVSRERDAWAVERQRVAAELEAAAKSAAEARRAIDDEKRRLAEERGQFGLALRTFNAGKVELARAAAKARRERQEVARAMEAAKQLQDEATEERAAVEAERLALAEMRRRLEQGRERLRPILAAAQDFYERAEAVKGQGLTQPAQGARSAAIRLREEVRRASEVSQDNAAPTALYEQQRRAAAQAGR